MEPANAEYLVKSGLLFEINLTVLHPVGLALTVIKNQNGSIEFGPIKDYRQEPEKLVFDGSTYEQGQMKLNTFMRKFGDFQMEKRRKTLGWACQAYYVSRYKKKNET